MSRNTTNWVDRGDPLELPLTRVLATALGVDTTDARLHEPVAVVRGQVEAAATKGEIATYVRSLFPLFARPLPDVDTQRLMATALWHIAKVGLDRDERRNASA